MSEVREQMTESSGSDAGSPGSRRVVVVVAGLVAVLVVTGLIGLLIGRDTDAAPVITIEQPRAGARVGTTAAVYLDVRNDGGADTITSARSPLATGATLHEVDERGTMIDGPGIPLAGSSTTALEPGGSHIMLTGVSTELTPGMIVPVTLGFERSPDRTFEAVVRPLAELADGGRS